MANNPKGPLKWLSFLRSPLTSKPDPVPPVAAEVNTAAEKSERKRQIDFVRKEELNYLRKLHQLQADPEHPQSWSVLPSSLLADSENRAQTLKKINDIEAQMSEQDWAMEPLSSMPAGELVASDAPPPQEIPVQQAAQLMQPVPTPTPTPTKSQVAPELEHAAIGFAKGDDAGVEQELLSYLERDLAHPELAKVWLNALLGLYRATDQQARLEVRAAEFKRRFGVDPGAAAQPIGELNASVEAGGLSLVGAITGDAAAALETLDAASHGMRAIVIDCRDLIRLDFSATVSLLNWTAQRQAEACEIQFQNAHPLAAAFLNVVGIGEYAGIVPSGYGNDVS
ncbi:MAG: STAS domain-containing protein [Burkholderiaceae bacterium]